MSYNCFLWHWAPYSSPLCFSEKVSYSAPYDLATCLELPSLHPPSVGVPKGGRQSWPSVPLPWWPDPGSQLIMPSVFMILTLCFQPQLLFQAQSPLPSLRCVHPSIRISGGLTQYRSATNKAKPAFFLLDSVLQLGTQTLNQAVHKPLNHFSRA